MSTKRFVTKAVVVAGIPACLVLAVPSVASAHVHADTPNGATQGKYAVVSLRVPNEEEQAKTVKLEVRFPREHPVSSAATKPVPGWQVKVAKTKLQPPKREGKVTIDEAVDTVTYTANSGAGIGPDEFQTFDLSIGPLPTDTEELVLPTVQTYDNGVVAAWTTPAKTGEPEPDKPAPVVALAAADSSGTAAEHEHPTEKNTENSATAKHSSTDDTARWLGGLGLVLGALGVGLGAGVLLRSRRS